MIGKLPCYVSGKGMFATDATTTFKTQIIDVLESSGLGYDTRYAYYQRQYPELSRDRLARLICDPIEYYDKNWPAYYEKNKDRKSKQALTVDFFLPLDDGFRAEAQAAIVCFDEAGFGTGVNCMRFFHANKPVLGFINTAYDSGALNKDNVYQLQREYPELFTLYCSQEDEKVPAIVCAWINNLTCCSPA